MSIISLRTFGLALSMLVITGCPSTAQVKEKEAPPPPRNLLGTTDELQLVTELLVSLKSEQGSDPILVVLAVDDTLLANESDGSCTNKVDSGLMPQMVQSDTAAQVDRMQQVGVKVIAISDKPVECADQIAAELKHYQINFEHSAWPFQENSIGKIILTGIDHPVSYRNGVLLSSEEDKGKLLKALLEESEAPLPGLIVMVDYQQRELSEVMKAFAFSPTKVHAWRYTRVDTAQN